MKKLILSINLNLYLYNQLLILYLHILVYLQNVFLHIFRCHPKRYLLRIICTAQLIIANKVDTNVHSFSHDSDILACRAIVSKRRAYWIKPGYKDHNSIRVSQTQYIGFKYLTEIWLTNDINRYKPYERLKLPENTVRTNISSTILKFVYKL